MLSRTLRSSNNPHKARFAHARYFFLAVAFGLIALSSWTRTVSYGSIAQKTTSEEHRTIAKGSSAALFDGDVVMEVKEISGGQEKEPYWFAGAVRSPGYGEMQVKRCGAGYNLKYKGSPANAVYIIHIDTIEGSAVTITAKRSNQ